MPVRVKVRAVICVGDQIVVHSASRRGVSHVTLPGGRVNERESVTDALRREVREELGIEIKVGDLMFAAEVVSGTRRQDVELIFAAEVAAVPHTPLTLVDPRDPDIAVLPPILGQIAGWRESKDCARWLGNIYASQVPPPAGEAPVTEATEG